MKQTLTAVIFSMFMTISFQSCAIAGGIFKAGVWVGILIVVLVIVAIIALISRKK